MRRRQKLLNKISLAFAVFLCLGFFHSVYAWSILGQFDWDPNPTNGTFTSEYGWTTVNTMTTGGNTGGWLSVTFTNTASNPPDEWSDVVHAPATNLFAGNWTTQMFVQFDFWQSNVVAGVALQVWWKSSTNDFIWKRSVTPQPGALQTWTTVSASLDQWKNWKYPGATEAQYLADLENINWIGVYIARRTDVEQVYGIDNFRLMIPEPAECVMLMAALISVGMLFRRKKRDIPRGKDALVFS